MTDLKRALPPHRSLERLRNHYEVEKSIANRLRRASREERKVIYRTMYEELFERVPDHPRLRRRADPALSETATRSKLNLLSGLLEPSNTIAEFAPGDCRFAAELSERVGFVYGIDISDQRGRWGDAPPNFRLILYDGYDLDLPDGSVDVVFSDQLVEHLHPEDTALHFQLVRRLLGAGGTYVFRTPHRFSGPHDVSRYFSDEAEGFHLKEWTYGELARLLQSVGYTRWRAYWNGRGMMLRLPFTLCLALERLLAWLAPGPRRALARLLLPNITIAARC